MTEPSNSVKLRHIVTGKESSSPYLHIIAHWGSTFMDMSNINSRLASFCEWPRNSYMNPTSLAKAGFYYSGERDICVCYSCLGKVKNWSRGNVPKVEHMKFYPSCRFIRQYFQMPPYQEGTALIRQDFQTQTYQDDRILQTASKSTTPNTSKYKDEQTRTQSYLNFPPNCIVKPADLVKSEFYYIGHNDKVKCAYCNGELYNWAEGDTAWGEHIQHFPTCSFVQQHQNHNNTGAVGSQTQSDGKQK